MDVQMPEMNGLEASGAIREHEKTSGGRIPIIAMTANAMAGDREQCISAGMDEYVSKPVRSVQLFEVLERFAKFESLFDEDAFRANMGSQKLMGKVIDGYSEEAEKALKLARESITAEDAEKLKQAAHAMKGHVGTYACPALLQAAKDFDGLVQTADFEACKQPLAELEELSARLLSELIRFREGLN